MSEQALTVKSRAGFTVTVARTAGFCFGVKNALDTVERERETHPDDSIVTYGPLIHNADVVKGLEARGIGVIESPDGANPGDRVVIRAHGVPRETIEALTEKGAVVVDATCPLVKRIHRIVEKASADGENIVILGDPGHPEVVGIKGWSSRPCTVIQEENEDIPAALAACPGFDPSRTVCLVAQTTFHPEKFKKIVEKFSDQEYNLRAQSTICGATREHQAEAAELAARSDMMIVVGGKNSSNTRKLYEICKKHSRVVLHVENREELKGFLHREDVQRELAAGIVRCVGVTAGASTPQSIIQEVVLEMSEMNVFEELLNESFKEVHAGDIVKGTVVSVTDNEVVVNIGYKSDAIMYKNEYSADSSVNLKEAVKVNDEIEVIVAKVGDSDVLVSRKRLLQNQAYQELEDAYNNRTVLTGKVSVAFDNGIVVLYKNNRVFIPANLVDIPKVDAEGMKKLVGQEVSFRIIRLQRRRGRIMGDRRTVLFDERNAKRQETLSKLEVGARMKGKVKNLTNYCAFVDLGGVDGMLHISEMGWSPVHNPSQVLSQGDEIDVMVKNYDPETHKISLTARLPENNPWNDVDVRFIAGEIVTGKVVRFTDFGAFVELEKGVDGLIHVSQLANRFVKHPSEVLKIGDIIDTQILDVDVPKHRISLSLRAMLPEGEEAPVEETQEAPAEEAVPETPAEETAPETAE